MTTPPLSKEREDGPMTRYISIHLARRLALEVYRHDDRRFGPLVRKFMKILTWEPKFKSLPPTEQGGDGP
jgi:hypothetical protein